MAKKKNAPDFQIGNLSDVGKMRDENQDFFGSYSGEFGRLIIVCDGMGGHQGGSVASRLAVQVFQSHFEQLRANYDSRFELEAAFQAAQQKIISHANEHPETKGMGTTAVALLIRDDKWWIAHTGDSRIYLKRGKTIRQITKDHSWVQGMVDSGILTPEQASQHPKRNIITKALGTNDFMPDVQGPYTLAKGDTFLLCSDGLYEYFDEKELSKLMEDDPQSACQNMINLANQRGGSDNITAQILRSNIGINPCPVSGINYLNLIVFALSLLALLLSAFLLYKTVKLMKPAKIKTEVSADSTYTTEHKGLPPAENNDPEPPEEPNNKETDNKAIDQKIKQGIKNALGRNQSQKPGDNQKQDNKESAGKPKEKEKPDATSTDADQGEKPDNNTAKKDKEK